MKRGGGVKEQRVENRLSRPGLRVLRDRHNLHYGSEGHYRPLAYGRMSFVQQTIPLDALDTLRAMCGRCGASIPNMMRDAYLCCMSSGNLMVKMDQLVHRCASLTKGDEIDAMQAVAKMVRDRAL